jgi:oxygen-independent coproporphyrinogen-3 oxidase
MAGIYIHIPFCRRKCFYCDFYKTDDTQFISRYINVLAKEITLRKNYLENESIETIYFGGGTPSVLTENQLNQILQFIFKEFRVLPAAEITFEANPDDLSKEYLEGLNRCGINRLSIGIQSFNDELLKKMNRRHNSIQAVQAVENAAKAGFDNISVDLIYGLPGLTTGEWQSSLGQVFRLPVVHLSAYHLTYHEGTKFYSWLKKGILKETGENESAGQFNILVDMAADEGFELYEISNLAKNQMYSKHNTSYWTGKKYLGLGPSAHSFNGITRQWNFSDIEKYLLAYENGNLFYEEEILTTSEKFNEYILTRLRTQWGVSTASLENEFGHEKVVHFLKNIEKYVNTGLVIRENGNFTFSRDGLFVSDDILAQLMII